MVLRSETYRAELLEISLLALCSICSSIIMMCESAKRLQLLEMKPGSISAASAGWIGYNPDDYEVGAGDSFLEIMEKMKINGSQVSRDCGRDDDWVKMNSLGDPINLLPTDPFEMNMASEIDIGNRISGKIERWIGCSTGDCKALAGDPALDLDSHRRKPFLSLFDVQVNSAADFKKLGFSASVLDVAGEGNFGAFGDVEGDSFSGRDFSDSVPNVTGDESIGIFEDVEEILYTGRSDGNHSDGELNFPHEGLIFSLEYLGVRDLLSAERVCRSLRSAVQNDPLLWRCIYIDSSLGEKITDDDLYRLTRRAEGNLRCLILVQCSGITFDGLKRVLDSNPMLKKLNVPGYISLAVDRHMKNLKTSELSGMAGTNSLKLGSHFIGSIEDLEELRLLVGADEPLLTKARKLHFFHDEICRGKGPDHCRACCACIERCADCGRCLDNCKYIETFFLNNICSVCASRSSKESQEEFKI